MSVTYSFVPKPQKIYHASHTRALTELLPTVEKIRDPEEGAIVYATSSKAFAAVFLCTQGEDKCLSRSFDSVVSFIFNGTRREFLALDRGGIIYELPTDTFQCAPAVGLGLLEWVSKVPVAVQGTRVVSSILEEMVHQQVQVYFVSEELFESIKTAPDHGKKIISTLSSENMNRGKYAKPLL